MTDIADLKDGNFYFVEKLETVAECFAGCLGGLVSSIAQDVTIKIKARDSDILKGIEIPKAYGDSSMWYWDSEFYMTKIFQLKAGKNKNYVLDLVIPANAKRLVDYHKNIKVAWAEATATE